MSWRASLAACCVFLTGLATFFAPDGVASRIRGVVTDALRPGQQAVRMTKWKRLGLWSHESERTSLGIDKEIQRLTDELETERTRNRAMQIQLAQSAERRLPEEGISPAFRNSQRLIVPSLTQVAVLGDVVAEQWRAGKFLDQGAKNGLRENELVLSSRKPLKLLVDGGEDFEISVEDALLLGRTVIGKIEHVGQWTSTIQLVTDSRYRGRAQVIRETSSGFVFEAQGILKGTGGPLCSLEGIPAEKSVRVNDTVYTAGRDGVLPTPLYYGHVVDAELEPDGREWKVRVKPASLPSHLTTVQVLRLAVNPERLAVKYPARGHE